MSGQIAVGVRPFARAVVGGGLSVSAEKPAIGKQPLDADGAARVKLVGADPHLGAEAEPKAVGKARAGVVKHARGIDLGQELCRGGLVFRDDGFGVARSVARDVRQGRGQIRDSRAIGS